MKPVISDAECEAVERALAITCDSEYWRGMTRQAISAFLLARVPEELGEYDIDGRGFNACREQVLQGRGDKA